MHSTHEVEPEPTSKHPCSMFQGQCPLGLSSRDGAVALGSGGDRDTHTHTLTHTTSLSCAPSGGRSRPSVEA